MCDIWKNLLWFEISPFKIFTYWDCLFTTHWTLKMLSWCIECRKKGCTPGKYQSIGAKHQLIHENIPMKYISSYIRIIYMIWRVLYMNIVYICYYWECQNQKCTDMWKILGNERWWWEHLWRKKFKSGTDYLQFLLRTLFACLTLNLFPHHIIASWKRYCKNKNFTFIWDLVKYIL